MNQEETAKLKIGDRVELRIRRKWHSAIVESSPRPDDIAVHLTRRLPCGALAHYWSNPDHIRPPRGFPPDAANVFADWLEERGFIEAALALRAAFPFCPAEGAPT